MKPALKLASIIVALLVIASIIVPTVAWDGATFVTVTIRVLDDDTQDPVTGAEVSFLRDIERQVLSTLSTEDARSSLQSFEGYAVTDSAGTCTVKKRCGAGGGNFIFWKTGRFIIEGPITIRADGYDKLDILIQNILGQKRFPLSQKIKSVTVYIKKKERINP